MTDDDREGFEPVAPDDAGDPAAAFEGSFAGGGEILR